VVVVVVQVQEAVLVGITRPCRPLHCCLATTWSTQVGVLLTVNNSCYLQVGDV